MNPELQNRVVDRLIATGVSNESWALVVLGALDGEAALVAYLDGHSTIAAPKPPKAAKTKGEAEPPGVFVAAITVAGFRGVGGAATLKFKAGPGLTLVIGRNGSGKSSFAEGLEFLLTGRNYRWEGRPKAWVEGWRNLHEYSTVSLKADLVVEGGRTHQDAAMRAAGGKSVAGELLDVAVALLDQKSADTRGLWPRASALLARQSLEVALKTYWSASAPGVEQANTTSQLLCLESYLSPDLGRQAYQVWTALSRATHHHPYELSPTREELEGWCATVSRIVQGTERAWRKS